MLSQQVDNLGIDKMDLEEQITERLTDSTNIQNSLREMEEDNNQLKEEINRLKQQRDERDQAIV